MITLFIYTDISLATNNFNNFHGYMSMESAEFVYCYCTAVCIYTSTLKIRNFQLEYRDHSRLEKSTEISWSSARNSKSIKTCIPTVHVIPKMKCIVGIQQFLL